MSEQTEAEDVAGEKAVAAATYTLRGTENLLEEVDDALAEFSEGHPTFSRELAVYDENGPENPPSIECRRLREFKRSEAIQVSSEWDFAAAYGYKLGLLKMLTLIDGWGTEIFDDDVLDESGLPEPPRADKEGGEGER